MPIVGRVARFFNPSVDSSDMSANRANQTHMFDKVWAHNHWEAKHEFLEVQNQLFTCGFDPTTDEGIEKAANKSVRGISLCEIAIASAQNPRVCGRSCYLHTDDRMLISRSTAATYN